ncbi:alpha/beta hydrolase [Mangrovibacterium sp.]|uniref:alpha/beta hydrolase n=1 Tax=Mangrovibacterium sp. TaxID=1961364 RepID=UPI00356B4FEA
MKLNVAMIIAFVVIVFTNTLFAQETIKDGYKFQTRVGVPPIPAPNVMVEEVTFLNRDMKVAGLLYSPKEKVAGKKYSAIVVGHPFNGVKEQTSGLHAAMLAELGYVALAYDATHYGESEGEPRQEEVISDRVEDFSAALDYLTTLDYVDQDRIGILGVCASGGYSLAAAQQDARFKAVATVSMFNMGKAMREGPFGTPADILKAVGEQRTKEANGEPLKLIQPVPLVVDANTPPLLKEFVDYYITPRGKHPRNLMLFSYRSLARLVNFYPLDHIETVSPRPILFIIGEKADSRFFADEAYSKAIEPKELFIVPGANHTDLYDQQKYMAVEFKKLDEFFSKYLGK